jgi:predicted dehydrogenase
MAAPKHVGFAVVGLGAITQGSVLPAFAHCKRAKLVALVSRDGAKAKRLATKFKARFAYSMDTFAECLSNPDISAVYIATPPGEHASPTIQAAFAGKHVLCEKPLAAWVEQSRRMVEACRKSGVLLMTAYRKHFEASTLYIKRLIQDSGLGSIDVIQSAFSELYVPGVSLPWLINPDVSGGGPLMDLGVYCVNTTRWLVDEDPIEVDAKTWCRDPATFHDVEQGIAFTLRFPSGLVAQATSSYGAVLSSHLFIQGTKGWLSVAPAFTFDEERKLTGKIAGKWIQRKFAVVDEFAPELDAFAGAIQQGAPIEPSGDQGHRDVIILNTAYESAKRATSVPIPYY